MILKENDYLITTSKLNCLIRATDGLSLVVQRNSEHF